MEPKFTVQLKIQRPPEEVFDAVVNPKKLSGYFVSNATGPLVEGKTVKWSFAEAPEPFDIVVRQVVKNEAIIFEWPSSADYNTRVEMLFKRLDGGATLVQVSERGWKNDETGIKASYGNNGGWMHMLCCLKAFLEFGGINLRAGGTGHGCDPT